MDEALYYLMEARSCIDSFVPVSFVDSFFEETDEVKEANEQNEKAKNGAIQYLKKAFQSLIKAVRDMIESFADFFKSRALSSEERERYKDFKKMIKSNPDIGKQKVTIADWRAYEKAYDEALKELEAQAQKNSPLKETADAIIEKLEKKIDDMSDEAKAIASRAALTVTLDTAVDIADQNVTMAKAINFALKNELIKLEDIEKSLGNEEAAKYNKKIETAAKNGLLHRMRVRIFKHRNRTFKAIIRNQFNKLLSFTNIKDGTLKDGKDVVDKVSVAKGIIKNRHTIVNAVGGKENAAKIAKELAKSSVASASAKSKLDKAVRKAEKKQKRASKEWEDLKKFFS